jgi:hypothetical protein
MDDITDIRLVGAHAEGARGHHDQTAQGLHELLLGRGSIGDRFLEAGMRPVCVFNGSFPDFKKQTVRKRRAKREAALRQWKEALRTGRPALKYAQQAARIDAEIVESSKELLELMGAPWIQAPSEGEAQCARAHMRTPCGCRTLPSRLLYARVSATTVNCRAPGSRRA